jgi:dienelactone hydrolase
MRKARLALAAAIAALIATAVAARPAVAACDPAPAHAFLPNPPAVTWGPERTLAAGVTARDVRFDGPSGRPITGEIVAGAGAEPHPGVLFVHWLGAPKTTNHTEFEPDAIALARKGATSLLVDALWSDPAWFDSMGKSLDADEGTTQGQVADLRRALDALAAQPNIDPHRIAYVGHDFGAMAGALLSCEDARPRWYVLMAGTATLSEWYLLGKPVPDPTYIPRLNADLDLEAALGRSKAEAFLFQYAAHDHYIAPDRALAVIAAAPLPKGAFWYDTDHALAVPAAFADRQAWLGERLFGGSS